MNLQEFSNSSTTEPTMVIETCEDKMELEVSAPTFSSADQPRFIDICDTEAEPKVSTPKFSSTQPAAVIQASEDGECPGDLEELNTILANVNETIRKFYCKEMMPVARQYENRAKNIKTTSACISFLATAGGSLGLGKTRCSKINVQPTAVSRRKADLHVVPCLKVRITKKRAPSPSANVDNY